MMPTLPISNELESLLERARALAIARNQAHCDPTQVLEVLLRERGWVLAADRVARDLDDRPRLGFQPPDAPFAHALRVKALDAARRLAREEGRHEVAADHLLRELLGPSSPVSEDLRDAVVAALPRATSPNSPVPPRRVAEPAQATASDSLLVPVTVEADDAHLVDRPALRERVMQGLMFGSALLVGPPGSGRRSLIRLVARAFVSETLPTSLRGARLLRVDANRLLAGTSYRGELEERVEKIFSELATMTGPVYLVVEELHTLAGSGSGSGVDVVSALVQRLRDGSLRLLGTSNWDDVRERLERHPGFLDQLTLVPVETPEVIEARRLLDTMPARLRAVAGVETSEAAIEMAVALCREHVPQLALPGAAVQLLRAAAARLSFETAMKNHDATRASLEYWTRLGPDASSLGTHHVMIALSQVHQIPFEHLDTDIDRKIAGLDQAFAAHVFGQDHVLQAVRATVKVALMNLADPRRPRGRLFFLGPPGTGKTECARLLAHYLMGSEEALLRLDMSEFQEASSVSSLIGSDKGLVGSEEGGRLTEPVRMRPHRVVLFDEIEKAHPNVYHLLLQILDNGAIHDKRGRRVSFRHALVLFTSNAGCASDRDLLGCQRDGIVERLRGTFRDEFLDRIECFVPFASLDERARRQVAELQLGRLAAQVREVYGRELRWGADVVGSVGSDPADRGARSVLRWMQNDVKPSVGDALLASRGSEAGLELVLEAGRVRTRVTSKEAWESAEPSEISPAAALH